MSGVRLSKDLEGKIMDWAKAQSDKPNKAEAIRRLIELGFSAAKRR
jgi:hypothetical protein